MRRLLGALAFLSMASPALADPPPGGAALELIASSNAEGVFEALPSERAIVVRHTRSGLTCRLTPGDSNRLLIFPQAARGEDVGCETRNGRESTTLYATRYSIEAPLDEQIRGVEAAIRQRFPEAEPLGATMAISSDTLPAHRTVQFIIRPDGVRTYTRASVAQVGQWTIKLRYSVVAPDAEAVRQGELAANLAFASALRDITQQRP
jgi:hypothetical protein